MTTSFFPPRRVLLGAGPSEVHPRVLAALGRPTIGHLDPAFVGFMDSLKELLQYALQTENRLTLPISAPGSAGMEACVVNLLEPGDRAVICVNGVFGGRMKQVAERAGAEVIALEEEWGQPVSPEKLERTLAQQPKVKLVGFVHAETSTGALSDAAALVEVARRHGCLTLVDTVTSLGGVPVRVDAWGIDAVYSGSQKCLGAPPGLSPVSFSPRAVEVIRSRKRPVQSWFLDTSLIMGYWGGGQQRSYHHTAPVNALYGLHEALLMLKEEGLEQAWARHLHHHQMLRAGLEAMGLELAVSEGARLPQLNVVRIPAGVDDALVRRRLLEEHGVEIGGGLGPLAGKVWRIGLMGQGSSALNVRTGLTALEAVLGSLGFRFERGAGLAAADRAAA